MLVHFGANRELSHLQGRTDDVVDVPDVDFPRHIELSAGAAFHNIASGIALFRVDRENGIRVRVHDGSQELKQEVPAINEARCVDAGKEAGQVLVEDEGR